MSHELSTLSCIGCRDRKSRCSRTIPQCSRCQETNAQCTYPTRQKRQPKRKNSTALTDATSTTETIRSLVDRIRRLEESSVVSSPSASSPTVLGNSPSAASISFSSHDSRDSSPRTAKRSYQQPQKVFNVSETMQDATSRVQRLRLQSFGSSAITKPINIPKDVARHCILSYCSRKPQSMFSDVLDHELLQLLPDIMDRRYVHIESVMMIIYYCAIYDELALGSCSAVLAKSEDALQDLCYLGALRAMQSWQREASGTFQDFLAALHLTRVSAENFDFDTSWSMFKKACEYCQGLNLHNLDGVSPRFWADGIDDKMLDQRRKDVWELMHVDLFFRLMHDMPPAIANASWKINMPWLEADSVPHHNLVESMVFLVSSRISFIIARFFAMIDEAGHRYSPELLASVEELCEEIHATHDEYHLSQWLASAPDTDIKNIWHVSDLILIGYTSIIHMIRKVNALGSPICPSLSATDSTVPCSPVVVNAARNAIQRLCDVLVVCPRLGALTSMFGCYRCYITFSIIADSILKASSPWEHEDDINLLQSFANQAAVLSRGQRDFAPLTIAMQAINAEIRAKMEDSPVV